MTHVELLQRLQALGIKLWLDGETIQYRAPQGALSPSLREELRRHKDAIRTFLKRATRRADRPQTAAITPAPRDGDLPLSFSQQRLWLLDQLEPNRPTYNVAMAMRLEGRLEVRALEESLHALVRRHEALRTTFPSVDGKPHQRIAQDGSLTLPIVDIRSRSGPEKDDEIRRITAEEARRPFSLHEGPLVRATLLHLSENEHLLLFTMHHIVSDGWSMGVLMKELTTLYESFAQGRPSPLPALPIQYADFAVWQKRWLSGELLSTQLAYWKKELEGAETSLDLPTDRPRPAVQSYRGAILPFALSKELSSALLSLSRQKGVTPFMLLFAAFQTMLHRYTGQEDIVVGSPVSGRTRAETEGLIGFFTNTLVLRSRLSGDSTFLELLEQVKKTTLGAYAHKDIPFEKLVEELSPTRDMSRPPLFQVMFSFQKSPLAMLSLRELTLKPEMVETRTSKFDLTFLLEETQERIEGALEYSTDLFDEATIARMAGHYQTLLEGIVEAPGHRLSEFLLLSTDELEELRAWNQTRVDYPEERCIHELFAEQAQKTPYQVAVEFEDQELRYAELDAQANRLAHHLRSLGVGPEVRVGLCVERSLDMMVGIFGILKAGGAYVPLDPSYPKERLAFMIADARTSVLVTQAALVDRLPAHDAQVLRIDEEAAQWANLPDTAPPNSVCPDNLAYIIYTSGSTGRPKGVALQHRGSVAFLRWTRRAFSEDELRAVLASTSISFDVSFFELFAPTIAGGRVRILRDAMALRDETLGESGPWLLVTVPSAARALAQENALLPQIRALNLAGEALDQATADFLFDQCPQIATIRDLYGPSEDTTYSTCAIRRKGEPATIGRAIDNSQSHVLDRYLRPLPIGVPGELYLSGAQLARGYQDRPSLSAERFVPDPFSDEPGARMYRTGDMARWNAKGELEFLGRTDHQVKIRGFRIELGEIESALKRHVSVKSCVLVAREDTPGDKRLVAYVTPQELDPNELRQHLRLTLPEHMVPSSFVFLDALPLSANGKIDRKALPAPSLEARSDAPELITPRTPVEELLAQLFMELLHVERVGARDDFFALGGHSLLATQLLSRIRSRFGVELPLRALFESSTVATLGAQIEAAKRRGAPLAPPIELAPRTASLPLSFAQQRMWFLDQLKPDSSFYNFPVAIRIDGQLDENLLEQCFREIIRRHEALRTTFPSVDGRPCQRIAKDIPFSINVVIDRGENGISRDEEIKRFVEAEAFRPFSLTEGPLFRVSLLRLSECTHVLVLCMHHIVSDGWSMDVMGRELELLYQALAAGQSSPLLELPIQYADYAHWQRQWLSGEVLAEQLAYWKKTLEGAPPALELPTDRPRPPVQSYEGAFYPITLPKELSQKLATLAQREGVTLFMLLLAAFQTLLHRYTGQDDILVGSPIAGRTRAETEGLIGFFVNTLVLRTRLSNDPIFRKLLTRVRETTLGAYTYQDLPFEKLVEELQPTRDMSRAPLFQVALVLQNTLHPRLALGELALEPILIEAQASKFDLTLTLEEASEGLRGVLEYNTDLFDKATIARMAGHLEVLLLGVVEAPERRLSEIPLLTTHEENQLLVAWNDVRAEASLDRTIHDLFEAQAARTPHAVAVSFEGQSLSYRELDERANQLAHHLVALELGKESLVGVCVERSLEMVIGILGILKAGYAFVPIDPAYPEERISFMLEDAGVSLVLTQDKLAPDAFAHERTDSPRCAVGPQNLAYVIYTSGSTGRPKGVLIEHRGACNLALAQSRIFGVQEGSRVLQFASLSFDAAVSEILMALVAGGALWLGRRETILPGPNLLAFLRDEAINVVTLTPSALSVVPDEPLPALRSLIVAGEACPGELVERWAKGRRFFNAYGPTEITVCATIATCTEEKGNPPIGRPLPNVRVYVLDAGQRPLPIGVPGELYVGGVGVARGYLHRPELSAERFLADPFAGEPGARMFRTGDICRWRADGQLEYLGRRDHQVKVRGYRIELGEIESALSRHGSVREAAVALRKDTLEDARLVAYVVPSDERCTQSALRDHLRVSLPEYMVPSSFVLLEALPLSPSGKLDRNALLDLAATRDHENDARIAPRTPTEKTLVELWQEFLGVASVGVTDDFFALGGHSLLAVRLLASVESKLGFAPPISSLFQHPTIEALAAEVDGTTARSRRGTSLRPVPRAPGEDAYPGLSGTERRLWFLDKLEPGARSYQVPQVYRLHGEFDEEALVASLEALTARHEILRTSYPAVDDTPTRRVSAEATIPVRVEDISDRRSAMHDLLDEEIRAPFDLERGPLTRVLVLRLSSNEQVLLLHQHHILTDEWSVGLLAKELSSLYHHNASLPPLGYQYADYARAEADALLGDGFNEARAYWKAKLAFVPRLELPILQSSKDGDPGPEAYVSRRLPRELDEALRALSRERGATPFMAFYAALTALLSRYSGQEDFGIGAVIANRETPGSEGLLGFFTNTVILRTELSGDPSFDELLIRAKESAVDAYRHASLPFDVVVQDQGVSRRRGENPFYDLSFVEVTVPEGDAGFSAYVDELPEGVMTAKDPIGVAISHDHEGSLIRVSYDTTRVQRAAVERFCGHLVTLVRDATKNPKRPLSELALLSEAEEATRRKWNDTTFAHPPAGCIHELFAEQAQKTPLQVAVEFEDQKLSYAELDAQANRLAHHLRSLGVGPEVRVGLCVERSLDMMVGIFGILKAGGVYVPLDPAYPKERLAFMIADARTSVLVTQATLVHELPAHDACVLKLDEDAPLWAKLPDTALRSDVCPDNAIYVIYTSGSTGRPKGVINTHRGLDNRLRWMQRAYGLTTDDAVLQKTPLSFDVSGWELFWPLLFGARLVVAAPEGHKDPNYLSAIIEARKITTLHFVPSMLAAFVASDGLEHCASLRRVICSGEELPAQLAAAFYARCRAGLHNLYGPTEAAIDVTSHARLPEDTGPVLIGRPIDNTRTYVLDKALRPLPVGIPGELYLSGVQLARAYLNRPALSAERFLPDPISDAPGARMYRTGDLARWNEKGELEFLGRIDHQVKIRGFRIELGEIEAALSSHDAVTSCVVVARKDAPGEQKLVAYIVPGEGECKANTLRAHLRTTLPEHMVPSSFVFLAALPLSPNGKIDRKALPAPEATRAGAETAFVAPRSEAEKTLCRIWSEVLRLSELGIHDNFFALGGDSILAIQVVGRARRSGLELTARDLFAHQTVAELAQAARQASAVQAEQGEVTGRAPLSPIQRWFFEEKSIDLHHFNQALLWTVSPKLSPELVATALMAIVRQHDALRLRYHRRDIGIVQEHASGADLALSQIDLSQVDPSEQMEALKNAADVLQSSLSLEDGPIARAVWIDLGKRGTRLLFVIHHLAVDGVSWRILHEDLERACEDLLSDRKVDLGPKTTSFCAFSERLHAWVVKGDLRDEIAYWRAQCARGGLSIPVDRSAPLSTEGESRSLEIALSEAETTALLRDVGAAYRTEINDILLSALFDAFAGAWGMDTLAVALEGHGREAIVEDLDLSRTVGWFSSLFPVWLSAPEGREPNDLIKAVKEELRAVPRRGVGYGWLRYAHPDEAVRASLAVTPQVVFNYLGQLDMEAQGRGLFGLAEEPTGTAVSPAMELGEALSINGGIRGGRLRLRWRYSPATHDDATIEGLATRFVESLRALIAHCSSPEAFGYTPSDFPLAKLDQKTLNRLFGKTRGIESVYPLSPLQAGLLFHALRDPSSPTYTVQLATELGGELDLEALEGAWRTVISHHAAYRSSFVWQGVAEPLAVVHRQLPFSLASHDWSSLPEAEAKERFDSFLQQDRHAGFDLSRAPLLRVTRISMPGGRTWMVKTEHHIVSDGWSGPIVLGDLQASYAALREGERPSLNDPIPYERYMAWLVGRDKASSEAFFRELLCDLGEPSRLGLPRPVKTSQDASGEHAALEVSLSETETEILRSFARQHGLTLNTLLQGALTQVLGRYTGRSDVVIGVTTSGRSAPVAGIEQMVGLFINTLPMRARWHGKERVAAWLEELQAEQAELRAHEATPLYEVQRASELGGGQALFDTLLVFENYPVDEAATASSALPIVTWRSFEQTNYALTIAAVAGARLELRWTWDPDTLRGEDIARFFTHLRTLLLDAATHPDKCLSELELLSDDERARLCAWNDTQAPYPANTCVHELFEEQVKTTPNAIALEIRGERLSYAELDAHANRLAHHLRSLGVGPERRVGLCVERSLSMMIGIFGILKAGGAYVPLDPSYPEERLSSMLSDAGVQVLLTQASLADRLPMLSRQGATLVCLDTDAPAWASRPNTAPASGVRPDNAMYLIYTSGSTGKPKGVVLEHRGLVSRVAHQRVDFPIQRGDRVLQHVSIAFDGAVNDWLWALCNGATLVLLPPEGDIPLAEALDHKGITVSFIPPSLLALLSCRAPDLRLLIVAGDTTPPELAKRFGEGRRLLNLYGPTEFSIYATGRSYDMACPERFPIGRPITNVKARVLDAALCPAPIGVPGELYLSGVGVARGYLNQPGLSAMCFVPDPYAEISGTRMYRTGDLARWNEDGEIEFLGRADEQVKIRGFRIEIGEIESALSRCGLIASSAVIAERDESGNKRLVAYVVPSQEECTEGALRAHLGATLPEHMVPSSFVKLDILPLSPNGKVDRTALLGAGGKKLSREEANTYLAPRDPTELELTQIWEEVFGRSPIGISDDFFQLGGHSLLAVRLVTRIEERFGQSIPLATLLGGATVESLARHLSERSGPRSYSPLLAIQPRGKGIPFFCVHPAGGTAMCYVGLSRQLGEDRPFYGLQAPGLESGEEALSSVEDMAARYIDAIRALQPEGPYLLGGWSFGGVIAFEMAEQLARAGARTALVALFDSTLFLPEELMRADDEESALADAAFLAKIPYDEFRSLSPDEQLELLVERLGKEGLLPPGLHARQMKRFVEVYAASLRAMRHYTPRTPGQWSEGRLLLLRAAESVTTGDLEDHAQDFKPYCAGPIDLRKIPGHHNTMMSDERAVRAIADCLRETIDEVLGSR